MKKDEEAEEPDSPAPSLAYFKIHERHRTLRFTVGAFVALVALAFICWTVVKVTEKNPWVEALGIVLAVLAGSSPFWIKLRRFRKYMERDHQRTVELEKKVDPNRSSSNLDKDGRFRHDPR